MDTQSAFSFLIDTLFDLYLMVVLLRIWMQLARTDFYNPLSQFVVKATHPVIGPLRRFIPPLGNLDTASLLLAYLLSCLKWVLLSAIANYDATVAQIVITAGQTLLKQAFQLVFWILIIRAILSWVSQGNYNPIESLLHQLTEPLLAPIRRFIPAVGGLDLSVLVLLVGLQFIQILLFH